MAQSSCCFLREFEPTKTKLSTNGYDTNGYDANSYDTNSYGRPHTLETVAKGYGRWLCFLAKIRSLDPNTPPLARVTEERLDDYRSRRPVGWRPDGLH
jgi:hypothetical protein